MSLAEGVTKSIQNPMLQLEDGTAIMERNFFKRIHEGYGFSISHRFEGVAADASADYTLKTQQTRAERSS